MNSLHCSPPFPVPKKANILVLRRVSMWLEWLYLFCVFDRSRCYFGQNTRCFAWRWRFQVRLTAVSRFFGRFCGFCVFRVFRRQSWVLFAVFRVFLSTTIIYVFSTNFGRFWCAFRSFCRDYILLLYFNACVRACACYSSPPSSSSSRKFRKS